jgi:hypothetical protein
MDTLSLAVSRYQCYGVLSLMEVFSMSLNTNGDEGPTLLPFCPANAAVGAAVAY